ncbi:MAG: hypothetical protein JXD22_04905 [Sedimentisphaerales bacterium]|nr:hypothetical protein [Sedimentisphaerales bacterium]
MLKIFVVTILRFPVVIAGNILIALQLLLWYLGIVSTKLNLMLIRHSYPAPSEAKQEPPQSTDPIEAALSPSESLPITEAILRHLAGQCPGHVRAIRKRLEATERGQLAAAMNTNRHLYAVLKPSKHEDLLRIAAVFKEMEPAEIQYIRIRAKKFLGL